MKHVWIASLILVALAAVAATPDYSRRAAPLETSVQARLLGRWTNPVDGLVIEISAVDLRSGQLRGGVSPGTGPAAANAHELVGWVSAAPVKEGYDNVVPVTFTTSLYEYGTLPVWAGYLKGEQLITQHFLVWPNRPYPWDHISTFQETWTKVPWMTREITERFRYDRVAIGLHWGIAVLILFDFATALSFGWYNPGDALYFRAAYSLHMSTGPLIIGATMVRIGWRLAHRLPSPASMGVPLQALARLSHALLYGFMLVVPMSGWLVLSIRRQVTSVFGLFSWAWPSIPAIDSMPRPTRQAYHDLLLPLHVELAYAGAVLLAVHVAAAIYHHVVLRDDVLRRMVPARSGESEAAVGRG